MYLGKKVLNNCCGDECYDYGIEEDIENLNEAVSNILTENENTNKKIKSLEDKISKLIEMFDLVFKHLGVKPKLIAPSVELVKIKK